MICCRIFTNFSVANLLNYDFREICLGYNSRVINYCWSALIRYSVSYYTIPTSAFWWNLGFFGFGHLWHQNQTFIVHQILCFLRGSLTPWEGLSAKRRYNWVQPNRAKTTLQLMGPVPVVVSVTRLGNISPLGQNCRSLWLFLDDWHSFGKKLLLRLKQIGKFSLLKPAKYWTHNLAIWSHGLGSNLNQLASHTLWLSLFDCEDR